MNFATAPPHARGTMSTHDVATVLEMVNADLRPECLKPSGTYGLTDDLDVGFWSKPEDRSNTIVWATGQASSRERKLLPGRADGLTVAQQLRGIHWLRLRLKQVEKCEVWSNGTSPHAMTVADVHALDDGAMEFVDKEDEIGVYRQLFFVTDPEPSLALAEEQMSSHLVLVRESGRGLLDRVQSDDDTRTVIHGYIGEHTAGTEGGFKKRFDEIERHKGATVEALERLARKQQLVVHEVRSIVFDRKAVEECAMAIGFTGNVRSVVLLAETVTNAIYGFQLNAGHLNWAPCGGLGPGDTYHLLMTSAVRTEAHKIRKADPKVTHEDALHRAGESPATMIFANNSNLLAYTHGLFDRVVVAGSYEGFLAQTGPGSIDKRLERFRTLQPGTVDDITYHEARGAYSSKESNYTDLKLAAAAFNAALEGVECRDDPNLALVVAGARDDLYAFAEQKEATASNSGSHRRKAVGAAAADLRPHKRLRAAPDVVRASQ